MSTTVDVHAHVLLPDLQELVRERAGDGLSRAEALELVRNGRDSLEVSGQMIRSRWEQLTDLGRRIADMDDAAVDVQVVSPSPSHYYPWSDADLASDGARFANEAMAALVRQRPDRLLGLGLSALQHPALAPSLLEHAVVDCGLLGVEIPSTAAGVELSDHRLEPFWARAVELDAVVFLHPFGCSLDERLDRFYLSNSVGQPVENAVAVSHLIFAGVLDRHPGLRIVVSHGGGYLPTFLGRNDHAWETRPDARTCLERPSTYMRSLYFDSLVHSGEALRALVAAVGGDRIVLGSDYPFDMGVSDPVDRLVRAGLPPDISEAIRARNVTGLIPSIATTPRSAGT